MQKIATRVFIYTSMLFGIVGTITILAAPAKDSDSTSLNIFLMKLLMICVFIILPSFALSVAGKYLNDRP
jgi:hypothetical protein